MVEYSVQVGKVLLIPGAQRKGRPIEMLGRKEDILPEVCQHTVRLLDNMVEKIK